MEHVDGRFAGVEGVELYWQGWLPDAAPRGVLLICPGMGEHSGRYATVVDALRSDGWAVYGLDHRGHGRSGGVRVHVRRYADFLADFDTFRRTVVARHPDLRPFLLGHSMGGQIALSLALLDQMTLLRVRARELRLPLLLQHGTADRICSPDGSRALEAAVGTDDLTVRWYDGLWHEIYKEPERAQPLGDLREWLSARAGDGA